MPPSKLWLVARLPLPSWFDEPSRQTASHLMVAASDRVQVTQWRPSSSGADWLSPFDVIDDQGSWQQIVWDPKCCRRRLHCCSVDSLLSNSKKTLGSPYKVRGLDRRLLPEAACRPNGVWIIMTCRRQTGDCHRSVWSRSLCPSSSSASSTPSCGCCCISHSRPYWYALAPWPPGAINRIDWGRAGTRARSADWPDSQRDQTWWSLMSR